MADHSDTSKIVIDLANVSEAGQLHRLLQRELDFGPYYGRNWNAFWDAITGFITLPDELALTSWSHLERALPEDAATMRGLLEEQRKHLAGLGRTVEITYHG
ncbi:barstar family protein [Spirillospora sp. CA-253888]